MNTFVKHKQTWIAVFLLSICAFLTFGNNIRQLSSMSLYDEAWNIHNGKILLDGRLTSFAWGPLVSFLFSLIYLVVRESPFWFLQSAMWGNFVLFLLVGTSGYLVCRMLLRSNWAYLFFVILFLLESNPNFLVNQSDALFSAMSAFALWQVLKYLDNQRPLHLSFASMLIGLSALARNDGVFLFGVFVVVLIFLMVREKRKVTFVLLSMLPFIGLVGGYLLLYGIVTGDFNPGTLERSYIAFRQGHLFVYTGEDGCTFSTLECAENEAERIFGSAEENQYSLLRAIRNNPSTYFQRVRTLLFVLPLVMVGAFGSKTGFFLLFFSLQGVLFLAQEKRYLELGLLLFWPAYISIYFLTFFRPGYFQSIYFLFTALAVFGLVSLPAIFEDPRKMLPYPAIFAALALSTAGNFPNLFLFSVLMAGGFLLAFMLTKMVSFPKSATVTPVFILIGLVLSSGIHLPVLEPFGRAPEDRVVLLMQETLPAGSLVAGGTPGVIWAADMEFLTVRTEAYVLPSSQALQEKLKAQGVEAIYADHSLVGVSEDIWGLVSSGIGEQFTPLYQNEERELYFLLVNP